MKVPLFFGSRIAVVDAGDDAVVVTPPPPPPEAIADVAAGVRDALRFPLAGEPLEALVPRGGRATVVIEPPALPLPGAPHDPRQAAIAATFDELARCGIPPERQTLLLAGGLMRRFAERDLERTGVVSPDFARRFRGTVAIHDAEDADLLVVGEANGTPLRANRALLEADVVVVVTAAETVLHGGPAALLAAGAPEALRAAHAPSLLESASAGGWQLAVAFERALARHVPVIGASLVLNHPHFTGMALGYPYDVAAVDRIAHSPLRRAYGLLPALVRERLLRALRRELSAATAFAGPPSVAHAEALLRSIEARAAHLDRPLDVVCIGIPRTTPHLPRERPNPLLAAYLGLGLALRLWRDAFPVADGGTAILLHRFHRRFSHPTQQPYRAFFQALRTRGVRDPADLADAERIAAREARALEAYRDGRSCHPLLPFADWAACAHAVERLGSVMIAGCRDAVAARQLGFVPTGSVGSALAMARGRAGGRPRVGFLISPPYFPLRVGA